MNRPEDYYIGSFNVLDPGQLQQQVITEGFALFDGMYHAEQLHGLAEMMGGQVRREHKQTDADGITRTDSSSPISVDRPDTELNPHTDGSRVDHPADLLTLYCEKQAERGGVSFFLSGVSLYKHLKNNNPDLLAKMRQPWLFGTEDDGCRAPVFDKTALGLWTIRFRRDLFDNYPKEMAAEIDDALVATEALRMYVPLQAGQGFIANNKTIMHGRTAIDGHRVIVRANVDVPEIREQLGFEA